MNTQFAIHHSIAALALQAAVQPGTPGCPHCDRPLWWRPEPGARLVHPVVCPRLPVRHRDHRPTDMVVVHPDCARRAGLTVCWYARHDEPVTYVPWVEVARVMAVMEAAAGRPVTREQAEQWREERDR